MSDWQSVALQDVCKDLTVGHVGSMASEYVAHGVPFLRSQNVRPGRLDLTNIKYISKEFHQRLKKSRLGPGDIVIVRTGEPGAAALVPEKFVDLNCSDLVIVRPGPGIDARFLCYSINTTARQYVASHLVGAVQQHFNVESARKLRLRIPSLEEQQAVATVLEALDDKIAVNNRIARSGEALALTLGSDERWITTVAVAEIVDHVKDQVLPETLASGLVAHYSIPAFDSMRLPEEVPPGLIKSSKFRVNSPSVLMSKLNPSTPRVWNVKPSEHIPSLASTEFLVLKPVSGVSTDELWAVCSQPRFIASLVGKVTGTSNSHQRVKPQDLLASEVVDPRKLPHEARVRISAIASRVYRARTESLTLSGLRDALLPGLMSGGIRVRDVERIGEDAT
jgi:type I restriction enzyme S subunit